ncbi:MAG: MAPEG family protein [Pseudomonadota bacterium]
MTPELSYLVWSVVLLILHIFLQAGLKSANLDLAYLAGPQDANEPITNPLALRVRKALVNFLETWPAFAVLALLLAVTEISTSMTVTGAALYFWGRVAYIPAYASGIPGIRTLAWGVSVIGLVAMLYPLLGASFT